MGNRPEVHSGPAHVSPSIASKQALLVSGRPNPGKDRKSRLGSCGTHESPIVAAGDEVRLLSFLRQRFVFSHRQDDEHRQTSALHDEAFTTIVRPAYDVAEVLLHVCGRYDSGLGCCWFQTSSFP